MKIQNQSYLLDMEAQQQRIEELETKYDEAASQNLQQVSVLIFLRCDDC
jgi:hypothetical protein